MEGTRPYDGAAGQSRDVTQTLKSVFEQNNPRFPDIEWKNGMRL
jgi:hypothetical protein